MLAPHLPAHDGGGVTAVTNSNSGGAIHQVRDLLAVALIGWCKVYGTQLPFEVTAGMELETVPPALVVFAKASSTFSYLVAVNSYQSTDWQHGTVHET